MIFLILGGIIILLIIISFLYSYISEKIKEIKLKKLIRTEYNKQNYNFVLNEISLYNLPKTLSYEAYFNCLLNLQEPFEIKIEYLKKACLLKLPDSNNEISSNRWDIKMDSHVPAFLLSEAKKEIEHNNIQNIHSIQKNLNIICSSFLSKENFAPINEAIEICNQKLFDYCTKQDRLLKDKISLLKSCDLISLPSCKDNVSIANKFSFEIDKRIPTFLLSETNKILEVGKPQDIYLLNVILYKINKACDLASFAKCEPLRTAIEKIQAKTDAHKLNLSNDEKDSIELEASLLLGYKKEAVITQNLINQRKKNRKGKRKIKRGLSNKVDKP